MIKFSKRYINHFLQMEHLKQNIQKNPLTYFIKDVEKEKISGGISQKIVEEKLKLNLFFTSELLKPKNS